MSEDWSVRRIAGAFTVTGIAAGVSLLLGIAKGKTIATLQGTEGIGIMGQFSSVQLLLGGIAGLGLSLGVIKYTSEYLARKDFQRISDSWRSAILIILCSSVAIGVAISVFSGVVSEILVGDSSASLYVIIVGLSIPFAALSALFNGLINGARAIRVMAILSVATASGSLIVTVPLVYVLGIEGVVVQIAVTSMIALALNYIANKRVFRGVPIPEGGLRFHRVESVLLLRYGFLQLTTTVLLQATLLLIQVAVVHDDGLSGNGLFQSAWAIWWPITSVLMTSIYTYMLPTMSSSENEGQLSSQVDNSLRLLLLLSTPGACVMILFSGSLISILYSPDFVGAGRLLQWMMMATVVRMAAFPLSLRLVARAHIKASLLCETSWYLVLGASSIVLLPIVGLVATGFGVLISNVVYFGVLLVVARREFGSSYSSASKRSIVVSLAPPVVALAFLGQSEPMAIIAVVGALIVWAFAIVTKTEVEWLQRSLSRLVRRGN